MRFNDGGALQWGSAPLSFWRRGVIYDAHLPMVTGQMIYNWLFRRHVLYISMIYLSLLIHILIAIGFQKIKEIEKRPHHLTFPSKSPLFTGLFTREVFGKEVTQHLT